MKRTLSIMALAALAACAAPPDPAPIASRGSGQRAAAPVALSQRCTNARYGVSVSYPAGWQTNDGSVIPACSAFDEAPIVIPRDSEIPFELAVVLNVETAPAEQFTRSSQWERVLSVTPVMAGGRAASRVEVESTGDGLADRGMRTLRYVLDLGGGRSLLLSTHSADPAYEQNKQLLGRMAEALTIH